MASRDGKLETVRTLVERGVDKEAKTKVRNLMIMMILMIIMMMTTMMMMMMMIRVILDDCDGDDHGLVD